MLESLLQGLVENPHESDGWLILADWVEEHDDPRRAVLLRLHRRLLTTWTEPARYPERSAWQEQLVALLADGVSPLVPQVTIPVADGVDIRFAFCPPGTFLMGSPESEPERDTDEPLHEVTLTQGFWLGIHPVTQAQWQTVMGTNPSHFQGRDLPVETVSLVECRAFLTRLGERTGKTYRLPTEAEWEYACRAGTTTPFFVGPMLSTDQANFDGAYTYGGGPPGINRNQSTPVGSFPPNGWGLYDMHGNVWEWCADIYAKTPLTADPARMKRSNQRKRGEHVIRGGAWFCMPRFCRSDHRGKRPRDFTSNYNGCRVVLCSD